MFVQVIQGTVGDAGKLDAAVDTWMRDLAPGAVGWLGTTAGVTEDGRSIALIRFESAEAAQANSQRAEQTAWWEGEMAPCFTSEPSFTESSDVQVDLYGDPDKAGFVQVMTGRSSDPERARELMGDDSVDWVGYRPDILGTAVVNHDGGAYTMAIYFTSEEDARNGEAKPPPPEIEGLMKEMDAMSIGDTVFFDLKNPWISSPG